MRLRHLGLASLLAVAMASTGATSRALAAEPAGPEALVAVELAPTTIAVGDRIAATLTLELKEADATREATFPDWSGGWGEAEVVVASPVEKTPTQDGVRLVQRLQLTVFKPGRTALPSVEVRLSGEPAMRAATSPEVALEVASVILPDDRELAPAPPSPPRSLAVPRSFWWTLAVLGALATLAAVLAWRRRGSADPLAAPELSPLAELERALGLLSAETPSGAFVLLSRALRRYLGRRLGFHALESTTTEVQRRLAAQRFDTALVQRAVRLLRLADQIKFAQRPAQSAEAESRIAETRALADEVEKHLAPTVEAVATLEATPGHAASGKGAVA